MPHPKAPPQFQIRRPCTACPFAPGGLVGIRAAFLAQTIDNDAPFPCHKTTSEKGRSLNHPRARYCAGHMLFLHRQGRPAQHMRLGVAWGLWDPEHDLDHTAPTYPDREALLAAHRLGGGR